MSLIVDQFGSPLKAAPAMPKPQAFGLYNTPRSTGEQDYYRQRYWGLTDLSSALGEYELQELLELSRQLFAQLPILAHAVRQKNEYAFGEAWIPQYRGENKAWAKPAEDWVHNIWLPQCSHAGGCNDWNSDLFISGTSWDVDGQDAALFVVGDDGFPRIAYRSAHQIGSGGQSGEVKGGPLDGGIIRNGIITDRTGRFIGVRFLRNSRTKAADDKPWDDIPAHQCDLQFEPIWRSQCCGIPRPSAAIMDGLDVQDIKVFLKRIVKHESSIGITHYNETGAADPLSDAYDDREDTTTGSHNATDVKIEKKYGGEILYMRANIGERLESFATDRPGSNSMDFLHGLEAGLLLSVGWFRELVDPSTIGGASVRLIQDQARHSVRSRQKTAKKRAYRALYFALSQAMQTGRIPKNNDPMDWMNWEFGMPAQLTVDQGYDEQADRENLVMGTTTLDAIWQKKGGWWQDGRVQRQTENEDLIDRAIALMAYANEKIKEPQDRLDLREALKLVQGASNMPESLRSDMAKAGNQEPAKPEKK